MAEAVIPPPPRITSFALGGRVLLYSNAITDATRIGLELMNLEFEPAEHTRVNTPGGWKNIPRQQAAFSDPGVTPYRFAGHATINREWTDAARQTRDEVERVTGVRYNFGLVNKYRHGQDYIGPHQDKTDDMVDATNIVTASFGTYRTMRFRVAHSKKRKIVHNIDLPPGSIVVLEHPLNLYYTHEILKVNHHIRPRVSISFRQLALLAPPAVPASAPEPEPPAL